MLALSFQLTAFSFFRAQAGKVRKRSIKSEAARLAAAGWS
jgi:hypothetical protein